MSFGFRAEERFHGELTLLGEPLSPRIAALTLFAESDSVKQLWNERTLDLSGEIDLEGIATRRPLVGSIRIKLEEQRVPYEFSFSDDLGRRLHFRAQKELSLLRLPEFLSRLEGTLYEDGLVEWGRLMMSSNQGVPKLLSQLRFHT